MPSVLQTWVEQIPLRMQSTVLLGLRGPDTHRCHEIKKIGRWLRGLVFKPANPANVMEFMGAAPERIKEKSSVARELEFCTQHYYSHLMHALEVVAYCYFNPEVAGHALDLYEDMCVLFHVRPEPIHEFKRRLETIEWPGGQPESFEEALDKL